MGLVQEHLDVGDPEQVKLFDEAMGTMDNEERMNKFLRILSNYLAQAKGSGSATSQNERLLEDLDTAIFLLHRVQDTGSPGQIVVDQITRLERRWPSLNGEGDFAKLKAQLERLPRLKIEIESLTSPEELRAHCFEFITLLQLCAMVNDEAMKGQEELERRIEAMRVQGQVQEDMIDALKAENGELLKKVSEDVKAGLDERVQAQEKEIEDLKAALKQEKAKRKALSSKDKEIADLKALVKQGKANGESQRKEIEALKASLERNKAHDEAKDKEIAELQALLKKDEGRDEQIAELVVLLEKEKAKHESQQKEIESLKTQLDKANSEETRSDELKQEEARQKLVKELKALRTENTRLQSELQKTKILEQKLESARTAQETAEDILNKQRSSTQMISVQLDDKTHEVEALTAANEKLTTKLAKKRQQKIDLTTQNAQLTLDLQEAHSSIERLQTQVDAITAKNEETQKSIAQLRETMATLSSDYETVCNLCDSLKERYKASQDKQQALKEKVAYLQTASGLSDMRSEYSAMKRKYEELSLKSESAKAKVRGMVESAVRLVCQKFASAIGETFGSAASGDELDGDINELADRIRVINSRSTAVLRKPRAKRQPLLPSMDELDREIDNLKHNIIH